MRFNILNFMVTKIKLPNAIIGKNYDNAADSSSKSGVTLTLSVNNVWVSESTYRTFYGFSKLKPFR